VGELESELESSLEFHCGKKILTLLYVKINAYYELLVSDKARVSRDFA
jgi:hypothetical protein